MRPLCTHTPTHMLVLIFTCRDREANGVVKRVAGFLALGDVWSTELDFWSRYNVYLSKDEIKNEAFEVLLSFKPLLSALFSKFVTLKTVQAAYENLGGHIQSSTRAKSKGSGVPTNSDIRRPTMKDAARKIMQVRRTSQDGGDASVATKDGTVNGLKPAVKNEMETLQLLDKVVTAAKKHEPFKAPHVVRKVRMACKKERATDEHANALSFHSSDARSLVR